jgi:hypothetical protein
MMDKMWMISSDGETESKVWAWVVWGKKQGCVLFDRTYQFKGHAIRRAKKLIEDGDVACVTKLPNANYYSVRFGNALSDLLRGVL